MLDISRLLKLPATLTTVTPGTLDEYGDITDTTVDTSILCWVAPETNDEMEGLGHSRFVGYFLPDTPLARTSRLTLGTATYDFDGDPEQWTHPLDTERKFQTAKLVRTS